MVPATGGNKEHLARRADLFTHRDDTRDLAQGGRQAIIRERGAEQRRCLHGLHKKLLCVDTAGQPVTVLTAQYVARRSSQQPIDKLSA